VDETDMKQMLLDFASTYEPAIAVNVFIKTLNVMDRSQRHLFVDLLLKGTKAKPPKKVCSLVNTLCTMIKLATSIPVSNSNNPLNTKFKLNVEIIYVDVTMVRFCPRFLTFSFFLL
jgi:hypothetical protein